MTATKAIFLPQCPRRVRPDITPSRSVCRQLFGPVNHEQLRADLLSEKEKLGEENNQMWNFDFENDVPLVGKYVWERLLPKVNGGKTVTRFTDQVYEMETPGRLSRASTQLTTTTTTTTTTSMSSGTSTSDGSIAAQEIVSKDNRSHSQTRLRHIRKTRSTGKITDFLRSAKRQRTSEKRARCSKRRSIPKQTSIDLFVRKH